MREVDRNFLDALYNIAHYWANLPKERLYIKEGETEKEAMADGIVHSILVMFDGDSGANNFKRYDILQGEELIGEDIELHYAYIQRVEHHRKLKQQLIALKESFNE